MNPPSITPVILCGGSGTRLWPRSRASKPKPFLPLVDENTLFEATLARCPAEGGFTAPIIVTGAAHLDHVETQLGAWANEAKIIVEPCARNTGPAIALAALRLPEDAIMLVCPSDHYIADPAAFQAAAHAAAQLAADNWLVSFGIEATSPETGFGYLERGKPIGRLGFQTARFIEKPDLNRARQFVSDGGFAWNGGIFAFKAGVYLAELNRLRPVLAAAAGLAVATGHEDGKRFHPSRHAFAGIKGESVDYAVMENTDRAAIIPVEMGWSDIGNWNALLEAQTRDLKGNATRGPAELVNCTNVLVDSDGPRVSAIGLSDVVIVANGNEILVTTRQGANLVGALMGATNQ